MAELWVINASPLITLSKVGQLELLQAVDRRLVIPEAVRAEVLRGPEDDPARRALESDFESDSCDEAPEPMVLEWGLGSGETAVLSFAKKNDANYITPSSPFSALASCVVLPPPSLESSP